MIRYFLFAVLCFPLIVTAQSKVGKSREVVKAELDTWKAGNAAFSPKITDAAATTTLSIKDPGYGMVKFIYTYNKEKLCISEKTIAVNDSARRNYLNSVLEQRGYEWKRINGNQYISKFADKLMIELPGDPKTYSFTVYRVDWTKETYDMLNKN